MMPTLMAEPRKPATQRVLRRVRYVPAAAKDETVVMEFTDPAPCQAVVTAMNLDELGTAPGAQELWVLVGADEDAQAWATHSEVARRINVDGGYLLWGAGRVAIEAHEKHLESLLAGVVEFAYFEGELRQLEAETFANWAAVEATGRLVLEGKASRAAYRKLGQEQAAVLRRRIRYARIERRLYSPLDSLPSAARKLGQRLREEFEIEPRLEDLDAKIDISETIYEQATQRVSEYRHFKLEYVAEVVIVLLLLTELTATLVWMWLEGCLAV